MSLVRAELRRLRKRRVALWMLVVVVLALGAIAAGVAATNQQVGLDEIAAAEEQARSDYEREVQYWESVVDDEVAACEESQRAGKTPEQSGYPPDCEEVRQWGPQPEWFAAEWYLPPTFHFREEFPDLILAFAGLLGLYAFIVGASFVGAEWRTGGMMNLLLWRPRRLPVLGAKLGTLLLALLALGVVLGAVWTAAFWVIALDRGITDTMTSGVWQSFALTGARGLALVLAAGAVGFGLASVGRHTAMALGGAVAAVVALIGTLILVGLVGVAYPQAWLWVTYLQAWMQKTVTLENWRACEFSFGECQPATLEITWQVSGLGIGAVVLLLLAVAMWQIRRRDVT